MLYFNITNIPNQSLSVDTPEGVFDIDLMSFRGLMYISISKDGESIVSGARCAQNVPLIPITNYSNGNLMFLSNSDEYPSSELIGESFELVYVTPEDFEDNG